MRNLNSLYAILWDKIKDRSCIHSLCHEIDSLYKYEIITEDEDLKLFIHFTNNKPTIKLHSEFLKSDTWIGMAWWWNDNEITDPKNRKDFIEKMMKITKPKNEKNPNK